MRQFIINRNNFMLVIPLSDCCHFVCLFSIAFAAFSVYFFDCTYFSSHFETIHSICLWGAPLYFGTYVNLHVCVCNCEKYICMCVCVCAFEPESNCLHLRHTKVPVHLLHASFSAKHRCFYRYIHRKQQHPARPFALLAPPLNVSLTMCALDVSLSPSEPQLLLLY